MVRAAGVGPFHFGAGAVRELLSLLPHPGFNVGLFSGPNPRLGPIIQMQRRPRLAPLQQQNAGGDCQDR